MPTINSEKALSSAMNPIKKFKDIIAGTCGGIAVTLVGHPFDTLKVRLQTQSVTNPVYSGLVDCFNKTVSKEGIPGLFKGMSSPLVGQMAFRATLFTSFARSKDFLSANGANSLSTQQFFIAGAMTGGMVAFAEGPIDFYKSQAQVQALRSDGMKAPSMVDTVKHSIRMNGIRGPFQGLSATLLRNIPANSVYFGSFEYFKACASQMYDCKTSDLSVGALFTMGGLAGCLYWGLLFPTDVIKSAMMSDSVDKNSRQYKTIISTTKALYQQGGVGRFYKGFLPCMLRATPANGLMLMAVDKIRNIIDDL